MEIIRRKILLENSIDRMTGSTYGVLTATTFNISIFLTQKFDDMGLFTDMPFIQTSPLLTTPPADFIGIGRPTGVTIGNRRWKLNRGSELYY